MHRDKYVCLKIGRGSRDRTYECRNQNPVPYHLATPLVTSENWRNIYTFHEVSIITFS